MLATPQVPADKPSIATLFLGVTVGAGVLWAARWVYQNPRKFAGWFRFDSLPRYAIAGARLYSVFMMFMGSGAVAAATIQLLPLPDAAQLTLMTVADLALTWFVFHKIKGGKRFMELDPEPKQPGASHSHG